ncbi:hypothetical protein ColLi_06657 [Colletotrichum liriopes]|uniref:Uncharacterized protein n=1 Tax=Colletotrichum liriopes TaxID=708192 RepID=A0AA37GML0_9PEZI|nr:hypothetical protein ColLi_06657 [Colletotrichum liriopes]
MSPVIAMKRCGAIRSFVKESQQFLPFIDLNYSDMGGLCSIESVAMLVSSLFGLNTRYNSPSVL